MSSPPNDAPSSTARRTVLWLAANAFASSAAIRISDPLLPPISAEFGVSIGTASVIATAYAVAYGLMQLVFGPLGDRFGKMRLVMISATAASFTVFACGLAPSLESLAAMRFVSGALAAAIVPLSLAYIGDVVPYAGRQKVLARLMFGTTSGLIFGQAASGILTEYLDWRAVFFVLAGLFLVAAIGLRLEVGRPPKAPPVPPKTMRQTVRDLVGLTRHTAVRAVLLAVFLEGMIVLGIFAYVGSHLHDRFGLRFDQVGLLLALFGIGGIAYSLLSPVLVPALGERGLIASGGACVSAGMLTASLAGSTTPFFVVAPLIGVGFSMFHNTLQTRATQMAPAARSSAVSLFASMFFLGQTAGVALAGVSYDRLGAVPAFVASAVLMPLLALAFIRYLTVAERPD